MSEKCCPNCGHCPTCGRSNFLPRQWWPWGYWPYYPYTPPAYQPYRATWTVNQPSRTTGYFNNATPSMVMAGGTNA